MVRQGYLDALDARAKERPLTKEERTLRKAIVAEQQRTMRWQPKNATAAQDVLRKQL